MTSRVSSLQNTYHKVLSIATDRSEQRVQTQTRLIQNNLIRPQGVIENSWSTQLSMKFFLLINIKMPTIVGIITFMSRKNSNQYISKSENS